MSGADRSMETVKVADDTFILRHFVDAPPFGVLNFSASVILGSEPILVDTHAPVFRDKYFDAVWKLVDPRDVRWVFVTHDDRDHVGNLPQVLEKCPNATLVTQWAGIARMSEEFTFDMRRVNFLNPGEKWTASGRTFAALRPPLYDSTASTALFDPKTRVLFSADCFGALVPRDCDEVGDVPEKDYVDGFTAFNTVNSPWVHGCKGGGDAQAWYESAIKSIAELDVRTIVSTHGPTAHGKTGKLLELLATLPAAKPFNSPTQKDLEAMLAGAK